jgi:hypothetical protein
MPEALRFLAFPDPRRFVVAVLMPVPRMTFPRTFWRGILRFFPKPSFLIALIIALISPPTVRVSFL